MSAKVGAINGFSQPTGGQANDPASLAWLRDGYFAIVNVPESSNYGPNLRFENNELRVRTTQGVQPVFNDHLVFQISQQATMDDWTRIPNLAQAKDDLRAKAVTVGTDDESFRQELIAFKLAVLSNVDIVEGQRAQLIAGVLAACKAAALGDAPVKAFAPPDPAGDLAQIVASAPPLAESVAIVAAIG